MVLESVMICVDNSEYSRNGDYNPNRWDSVCESANLIASAKIQSNAETTVGLLSLSGKSGGTVHVSLTRNNGAIMNSLAKDIHIEGYCNYISGLRTASLALKNRQNKNSRQRIILFIGSPISEDSKELVKLGKSLKKNAIAVDCINYGTENSNNDNVEKLEQFIAAVNASDNSHLINIPPGPHILADMILTSSIMSGDGGNINNLGMNNSLSANNNNAGAVGNNAIDPNIDPEMAMAIRMSMEEERQRQQRLTQNNTSVSTTTTNGTTNTVSNSTNSAAGTTAMEVDDEEALLQQAIAMSMQQESNNTSESTSNNTITTDTNNNNNNNPNSNEADIDSVMNDPDFINSLINSVPGANPNDLNVQNLLNDLNNTNNSNTSNNDKSNNKTKDDDKNKK